MARTPKSTRKLGKRILRLKRWLFKRWKTHRHLVKYGISQTGREYDRRHDVVRPGRGRIQCRPSYEKVFDGSAVNPYIQDEIGHKK